jgi:hypothetical protein
VRKISVCFLGLGLLLNSCAHENISVFSEYISETSLASYYVNTPDPNLYSPPTGQRLFISWNLPDEFLNYNSLKLKAQIRFRNRQEITLWIDVLKRKGRYIYTLLNKDFFATEGILTYKIQLFGDDNLLDEWRHQIWVDLITFPDQDAEHDKEQEQDKEHDEVEEDDKEEELDKEQDKNDKEQDKDDKEQDKKKN